MKRMLCTLGAFAGVALFALRGAAVGLDIVAQSAYLRADANSMGPVINDPAIGAQVYVYVDYMVVDAAAPVTAQVRASLDGHVLCGGPTELQPGAFAVFCTSPWVATGGQHTLLWEIDFDNGIAETNEGNNTAQIAFAAVDATRFDVEVRRTFLRSSPDANGVELQSPALGQPVYLYTEYLLSGTDFPVTSSVRALLDGALQCSGVNQLALGDGNRIYCTAPWTATAGMHTLRWEYDFDQLLSEVNEDNNSAQIVFTTGAVTSCAGDCSGDGTVSINELVTGVNIALGSQPLTACAAFDTSGDGMVGISELIAAVGNALGQCG